MPLLARGPDGHTFAAEAQPNVSYFCLSCDLPLLLRRGKYIRHFYHPKRSANCRLYSKGEDHLFFQWDLQKRLPEGEAELETPFSSIQRVADVCWQGKQIVFEIQCSSISLWEAQKRVHDYGQVGFQVVWILDDRVFNRKKWSEAEGWIRRQPSFYLSFSRQKQHCFYYDQLEILWKDQRIRKSRPYPLSPSKPFSLEKTRWPVILPLCLKKRIQSSPLFFHGDLLHLCQKGFLSPFLLFRWAREERLLRREKQFHWLISLYLDVRYFMNKLVESLYERL